MWIILEIFLILFFLIFSAIGYVYYKRTIVKDIPYELEYLDKSSLGPYYVDLESKLIYYPDRDSVGGILDTYKSSGEKYFHPIRNTHYALAVYARYLSSGLEEDKKEFLKCANSIIVNRIIRDDGSAVWYYPHIFYIGQKTPWISAMAQGQVIAVMVRAWECTKDNSYLQIADETLLPFTKTISQGGVISDDNSLGIFFEEYAHFEIKYQHHTLNGMLSALFGIYDYWKISKNNLARQVFDEGVKTIRSNLSLYDFPFCSTYDLRHVVSRMPPLFNPRYNSVHVAHLHILAKMTGDDYFEEIAECWNRKITNRVARLRLSIAMIIWKCHRILSRMQIIKSG